MTFADAGDRLVAAADERLDLSVTGRFGAKAPSGPDNLVFRAAERLRTAAFPDQASAPGARITLDKALPVASGLGGGSADAAAALRALNRLWGLNWPIEQLARLGLELGADIPMCLYSRPLRARGIGEDCDPIAPFPALSLALVNPGAALSTADVFGRLAGGFTRSPQQVPGFETADEVLDFVTRSANDLMAPAIACAPVISDAVSLLSGSQGCRFAGMSGSGATCFGVYAGSEAAGTAAASIAAARPEWWVVAATTAAN